MKLENLFHLNVVKFLYAMADRVLNVTKSAASAPSGSITRHYLTMQLILAKVVELSPELVPWNVERHWANVVSTSPDQRSFNLRCDELTIRDNLTEVSSDAKLTRARDKTDKVDRLLNSLAVCCFSGCCAGGESRGGRAVEQSDADRFQGSKLSQLHDALRRLKQCALQGSTDARIAQVHPR